jgi:beta-lactamase regulating signal transducer with metallopeptidase domain/DUF4097 and DUF4098 domain-containing protein YvlB
MNTFIASLLSASLSMSAIAGLVLLLNKLTEKRIPSKIRYYMWLIVLAGLLLPYRPEMPVSLKPVQIPIALNMPEMANSSRQIPERIEAEPAAPAEATFRQTTLGAAKPAFSFPFASTLLAIWIIGALTSLAFQLVKHAKFARAVKRWGVAIEDENTLSIFRNAKHDLGLKDKAIPVKECTFVSTPMLMGLFTQVILLPSREISAEELDYTFRHELTHYKRKDIWVHLLVMVATALHWFNPLVYLLAKVIRSECETACDESVIAGYGIEKRREYGETILGFIGTAKSNVPILSTYFFEGSNIMKKRLFAIMDTGRKSKGLAAICIPAVIAASVAFGNVFVATARPASSGIATENAVGGAISDLLFDENHAAEIAALKAELETLKVEQVRLLAELEATSHQATLDKDGLRKQVAMLEVQEAALRSEVATISGKTKDQRDANIIIATPQESTGRLTIQPPSPAPYSESRVFALEKGGKLEIINVNGAIIVSGWDKDEVALKADFRAGGTDEHIILQVDSIKNILKLVVEYPKRLQGTNFHGAFCTMELKVPNRLNCTLSTMNGSIALADVTGNHKVKPINGRVNLNNISGDIDVANSNGDIALDNIGGDIRLSTANGFIVGSIANIENKLDVTTSNGDIKMKLLHPKGSFEASTMNGQIKLQAPGAQNYKETKNDTGQTYEGGKPLVEKTVRATFPGNARMKFNTINGSIVVESQ